MNSISKKREHGAVKEHSAASWLDIHSSPGGTGGCSWGGLKASPNAGAITTNTNHFPNKNGRERQTWVRGARIDIPISVNNESFPLRSEERGCRERTIEGEKRGDGWVGERRRRRWGGLVFRNPAYATMESYGSLFSTQDRHNPEWAQSVIFHHLTRYQTEKLLFDSASECLFY